MKEPPSPPVAPSPSQAHAEARSGAVARPASGRFPLAIIGPGALGLHFAARLDGIAPVALIARDAAGAARLNAGVEVGGHLFHPNAFAAERAPEADWVIVLVKA
ncbi:MAG TPA: 2-dehydropantoate 2-reductase N-terminal domain-containing protein, partial [Thauera aminoaromatica]|nr:2-dehydropantoate 2-reductase N-terminal domain-containing protein [Thauera aminoaromatica]